MLGDMSDFSNLFKQYKLTGAKMKIYFSTTAAGSTQSGDGPSHAYDNSQILVRMTDNIAGTAPTLDDGFWQSTMAKKYRTAINGGKPISVYCPLRVKGKVHATSGDDDVMMRPRWTSTLPNSTAIPHYGVSMSVERVDGQGFTTGATNAQYMKIITTLYFKCRKVE